MKKKEKRLILILIAILVVVLIIGLFIKKNRNEENGVQSQQNTVTDEKFVQVLEDGTKLNKSSKFNETKNIDGIEYYFAERYFGAIKECECMVSCK